jgi:4-hydroxy-tetrahydrodipicolinate reductase
VIKVAVIGATGRMGLSLIRALQQRTDCVLGAAICAAGHAQLGKDSGSMASGSPNGVLCSADLPAALRECAVAIDFSVAAAAGEHVAACVAARRALLLGTTGHDAAHESHFAQATGVIPLMIAPNTSIGVSVLLDLVQRSAQRLPADFDIEISEAHHRHKKDAPSGTALALGEVAARARGLTLKQAATTHGSSAQARDASKIGFAVTRGGDIVGEHSVLFAGAGEQLVLTHRATDRAIFARGALRAALWLMSQPAGRYDIQQVS